MDDLRFIWCVDCLRKKPPIVTNSSKLIPLRSAHYELSQDGLTIDKRVVGVCEECLEKRGDFHKKNAQPVDYDNPNLVRRCK